MAAQDATMLITSATANGTALGFVQSWQVHYQPTDLEVHGAGATGPQALGTVAENLVISITYLNGPFLAPSTAPGTVVLVGKDTTGAPKTLTAIQMKPRGITHTGVVQGWHTFTQEWTYVGDFAVFPLTAS